jgi:hypothetical protein
MKIVKRRGAAPRFLLKRRGRQARGFHMGYLLGDHSARSVSDARFGGTMAMRNALAFGGSLLIASTAAAQTEKVPPADRSAAGVTAFVGVSVVPGDRARVQHDQTVLVERARIVRMGPAAKVRVPEGRRTSTARASTWCPVSGTCTDTCGGRDGPIRGSLSLKLNLANGVTTVRETWGTPKQIAIRDRINRGELLGPRTFVYGPAMNRETTLTPEIAERQVREFKRAGYDRLTRTLVE